MKTRYLIMRPGAPHITSEVDWPRVPKFKEIAGLVEPLLESDGLEHVSVLADFDGGTNFRRADMFVGETSSLEDLPRNEAATAIYRRNALQRGMARDPESLPAIYGTAVLFDRPVWF